MTSYDGSSFIPNALEYRAGGHDGYDAIFADGRVARAYAGSIGRDVAPEKVARIVHLLDTNPEAIIDPEDYDEDEGVIWLNPNLLGQLGIDVSSPDWDEDERTILWQETGLTISVRMPDEHGNSIQYDPLGRKRGNELRMASAMAGVAFEDDLEDHEIDSPGVAAVKARYPEIDIMDDGVRQEIFFPGHYTAERRDEIADDVLTILGDHDEDHGSISYNRVREDGMLGEDGAPDRPILPATDRGHRGYVLPSVTENTWAGFLDRGNRGQSGGPPNRLEFFGSVEAAEQWLRDQGPSDITHIDRRDPDISTVADAVDDYNSRNQEIRGNLLDAVDQYRADDPGVERRAQLCAWEFGRMPMRGGRGRVRY